MREVDLTSRVVAVKGSGESFEYTIHDMLNEFVWGNGYWANDEATAASFSRVTAESKAAHEEKRKAHWQDGDHGHVMRVLRDLNFQGPNAISLSHLRNVIALMPAVKENNGKKARASA